MDNNRSFIGLRWIGLMDTGIFLMLSISVNAQTDSVVTGLYFSSYNLPLQYTSPVYFKSSFDLSNHIQSYLTGQNPVSYSPGTKTLYTYDQQGRCLTKDSILVDVTGVNSLASHESFAYSSQGAITHHMFFYQGWIDSTVYYKDAFLRDSVELKFVNSLTFPKTKSSYYYQGSSLNPNQIVESNYDSVSNTWTPSLLHLRYYTSFDSIDVDTLLTYDTTAQAWLPFGYYQFYYGSNNYLSDRQEYFFLNGVYDLHLCKKYFYNSINQITNVDEYYGACSGIKSGYELWNYNQLGRLMSYIKMKNLSSLNCGWFTLANYQYIRDASGRLLEVDKVDNQPSVPCSGNSTKTNFYFGYADKGKWSITLIAPVSSSTHCDADQAIVYLLSVNEPTDAVNSWKEDNVFTGLGIAKTVVLKENLVVSVFASSASLNDTIFSNEINFHVQGKSSFPILSNGSPNDVEKCDQATVMLVNDSLKLKNPLWFLNGVPLSSFNGKFSVPATQQGEYACRAVYQASPYCPHDDKVVIKNVSPHPKLISTGTNISNLLTIIADDSFEIGNSYDWYKNAVFLCSTNDGKLNISSPGTYYCKVKNSLGCESSSGNLVVAMYNAISENDGVWFANPLLGNQLILAFDLSVLPLENNFHYRITDVQGRLILDSKIVQQNEIVTLRHGSANYFMSIYQDDQLKLVKKILVVDQ